MNITQLPFGKVGSKKKYILPEPLFLDQWIVPQNTKVKLFVSPNFGYIILPNKCQDERGFTIPRHIFKY